MAYTILAAICQHPIRQSNHLPWSGSTLDFDVRYCSDLCAQGLQVRTEHRAAERGYEDSRSRYDRSEISRDTYRDSRRRYDNARTAAADYAQRYEERDDRDRLSRGEPTLRDMGRRFAGLDDPSWNAFRREVNPRHDQRVRIGESSSHRRESQYREQPSYRRSSREYDAGRYADTSGSGFHDTSNPTRRESHGLRRVSTASSQRSDSYLDSLNMNELADRQRRIEAALARYR